MKHRSRRRTSTVAGAARKRRAARQQPRLAVQVGRQIEDIYHQMDDQLTRMAEIQLQFDRLRSTIRIGVPERMPRPTAALRPTRLS